jgi:hypothetical protein
MNRKQVTAKRKATAGIIAGVIIFAMIFTVGTSYFLFVGNSNRMYDNSLVAKSNGLQGAVGENLQTTTILLGNGHIGFFVNNTGGLNVNMTAAFVFAPGGTMLQCGGVGLPTGAGCSNTTPTLPIVVNSVKGSATVDTGYTFVPGTTDTVKILTQRGNAFTATFPQGGPVYATQAQAIGPAAASLPTFKWMQPTGTQQTGALVAGYPTIGVTSQTGLQVDTTATSRCAAVLTCTLTISTTRTNDLIWLQVSDDEDETRPVSVSDAAILTWTLRTFNSFDPNNVDTYSYYAIAGNTLSSDVITYTVTNSDRPPNLYMIAVAVSGVNTASPFDPNLPNGVQAQSTSGSTASVTFTTTNPNDMIIGAVLERNYQNPAAASGYTSVSCCGSNVFTALEYQFVSSAGSNTPSFTLGGSDTWLMMGDAVKGGVNIVFSASFTDVDPLGRGITIWPGSSVATISGVTGGPSATSTVNFYIVDGLNNANYPTGVVAYNTTKPMVHLVYRVPTTIYFGATAPRGNSMNSLAILPNPFQALFEFTGQYDDKSLYGQTVPFPNGVGTTALASLSAYSGGNGASITVTGSNFAASAKSIVGWIDSTGRVATLKTFTTSAGGTISNISFQVPTASAGYYTIIISDYTKTAFLTFQHT